MNEVQTTSGLTHLRWWCAACLLLIAAAVPRVSAGSPYSMTLVWTATGDDANQGRAYRYELRYSTSGVADPAAWWSNATVARNLPTPSTSGVLDSTVVGGLAPGTTYYFILRVYDDGGNVSDFSNVVAAATDPGIPLPPSMARGGAGTVHAYPNPSRDAVHFVIHVEGDDAQRVQIRLFDAYGRAVTDIADGSFPSGDTTISWPRVTRNGDRVAPGYYESIGTIGAFSVRERLILLP